MNKDRNEIDLKIDKIEELIKERPSRVVDKHMYFAVMILLVNLRGRLHILYEVRSPRLANQPNEVSFPGGKIENGETPRQAAFRETFEEVGIKEDDIRYIGKGDRVIAIADFTVYSYIGYITEETFRNIQINEDEVAHVFVVPLEFFLETEPEIHVFDVKQHSGEDFPFHLLNIKPNYEFYTTKTEIPIYLYDDKAIWGLTGRLTRGFIKILKEGNVI